MTRSVVIAANTAWNVFNFRAPLIRALIEQGYEVVVLAPLDDYAGRISLLGCRYIPISIDNGGTNPIRDFKLIADFYRILSKVRPHCFLGYTVKPNLYGSISALLLGIPTINTVEGLGTAFVKDTWVTRVAKLLYRLAFYRAHKVFLLNNEDLEYFMRFHLVRAGVAFRIPGCGLDTKHFVSQTKYTKNHRFYFLLIGRLLWDKGIKEFVEAARIIRKRHIDVEFQLLGFLDVPNQTAVPRSEVEQWEAEGLISYLGCTDDVRSFIDRVDCVVLPSYYKEGVPRVLLEAASMSKPIITTDSVGCRDVVDDGVTGFMVKTRDVNDLAEKMEKMLLLPKAEIFAMGQHGREKMVREFDESIVIQHYLTAVNTLAR